MANPLQPTRVVLGLTWEHFSDILVLSQRRMHNLPPGSRLCVKANERAALFRAARDQGVEERDILVARGRSFLGTVFVFMIACLVTLPAWARAEHFSVFDILPNCTVSPSNCALVGNVQE